MGWRRVAAGIALASIALAAHWAGTASAEGVEATGSDGDLEISLSTDKTRYDPDETAYFLIKLTRAGRPVAGHEVGFGGGSEEDLHSAPATTSPNGYARTDRRGEARFSLRFTAGPAEYVVSVRALILEPGSEPVATIRIDARRAFYLRRPFVAGFVLALIAATAAVMLVRRRRASSRSGGR